MIRKYLTETQFEDLNGVLNSNIDYVVVKDDDVDKIVFVTNNIDGEDKTYEISAGSEPAPVPLEILSWSYNDRTKVPSNPIEQTLVKPTINTDGLAKLLISFKFNQNVDETTVNKDNFVVGYVDSESEVDYTLTYPTPNTVLLSLYTGNPYDCNVSFNSTPVTIIIEDFALSPIAKSTNEPATYSDLNSYTYKRSGEALSYEKHNTDKLKVSFIVDNEWNSIRTNVKDHWIIELSNIDYEYEASIKATQIYKIDNFICLEFNMTDISLGTHYGFLKWCGYTVSELNITIIE